MEKIQGYKQAGKPIVYLDESGFAKDMPRTHGYSKRGTRCYGKHDWHARGRVNVIGAMNASQKGLMTLGLFETTINSDVFFAWLTQDLLPKMPRQAVMVMDNARFHKRADIIQAIHQQAIILEYLPPYSPDLNPIEHQWAKAKAIRRQKRCGIDELFSKHITMTDYG